MDNNVTTSEKITKWLLIGISVSVSGSNAPPSVTYSNHRSPSKRMEGLRRCGNRRIHHQSTSPYC